MNERDDRETRAGGGVSDRGAATVSEPAQDFVGNAHATQRIQASGERHLTRRQLENVRAASSVENVRSLKKTRKTPGSPYSSRRSGSRRTAKPRWRRRAYDHNGIASGYRPFSIFHWLQAGYWNERDVTILLKNNVRFEG